MLQLPNFLKALITFLSFPLLVVNCSQKTDQNEAVIKAMEESLERSTLVINASTNQTFHSLEEKTIEPATTYKAEIWLPKAKKINEFSTEIFSYLEKVKRVEKIDQNSEKEIITRLLRYKENLASVDSSIRKVFNTDLQKFINTDDTSNKTVKEKNIKIFNTSNIANKKALLTKFQNSIKILENKTIIFCNEQIGSTDGWGFFDSYSAIVGQSSNIVKAGSKFEINAGVGAYSLKAQPNIQINGKQVPINEQGFASFKLIATQKPGDYKVPVLINYLNPATGKKELRSINIEYTVAKPCN